MSLVNITPLCRQYNKKPSHFLDNQRIVQLITKNQYEVTTKVGRYGGGTWIPEELMKEFYIWLSEETRTEILEKVKI